MSAEEKAPPANEFENMSGNNSSGATENDSSGAKENSSGADESSSGAKENSSGANENSSGAKENSSGADESSSGANENSSGAKENSSATPPAVEKSVSASPAKPAAAPLSTSGYIMSPKAKDLQARRKALLVEMQAEYAKVFGDDKKAPKAKAYHAAGLLTIKERDGEAAYKAKLQEYIAENQRKFEGKTAKAPKASKVSSAMSLPASAPKNTTAKSASSHSAAVRSIETMGASINTMVEKIIAKAKSLGVPAPPAANSARNHSKKRKVRSNKGGTHKHRKPAYKPYVNE